MEDRSREVDMVESPEAPVRLADSLDSVTLARLLDEVRNADEPTSPTAYNRMHNRHNRS